MEVEKCEQDDEQRESLLEDGDGSSALGRDFERASSAWKSTLRLGLELIMGFMIVVLSLRSWPDRRVVKSSAVPNFPIKTYTFVENPRYLHENMFESKAETLHTLHNWIELSAEGRGYVRIENAASFGLGEGYPMKVNSTYTESVYMISAFHQLHCLSYLVQAYQTAIDGGLTQEIKHHSAHCFDYIRQSIMCAADTSLEGKTDASPGWGSKHQCTDYDALLAWANERTVVDFRNGLLPGEAVL